MLLLEHDDEACGLAVEGAGNVFDGVLDELLDAGVRDGGFVGDLVEGAAGADEFEEGLRVGGHGGGCACCCEVVMVCGYGCVVGGWVVDGI